MHAAVVGSFDHPPRYETFEPPEANGEHEHVVDVLAAGLHPRVRSGANGSHYTSGGELPLIPGIDGVGRTSAGELLYFVLPDTTRGSMAERSPSTRRRSRSARSRRPGTCPSSRVAASSLRPRSLLKNSGTPAAAHPRRLAPPAMLTWQSHASRSRPPRGIHGCTTSGLTDHSSTDS